MRKRTAGEHIKSWRRKHKLTKAAAGKLLGISEVHVYYLETGRRFASPVVAEYLSEATGQPITAFLNMAPR